MVFATNHPIQVAMPSAAKMSRRLTAAVDAWAEAHGTARSDAIRQLVEFGLSGTPPLDPLDPIRRDSVEIEDLAVKQIDDLLDPRFPFQNANVASAGLPKARRNSWIGAMTCRSQANE
jgi:hypothetical protein